jgi:hypothetical protein
VVYIRRLHFSAQKLYTQHLLKGISSFIKMFWQIFSALQIDVVCRRRVSGFTFPLQVSIREDGLIIDGL